MVNAGSAAARHAILAALVCLALGGCNSESPEKGVAGATQSIAKKDYRSAVIQLKSVLQKSPDHAEARFLLGKALLEGGDVPGALVELKKARELRHSIDAVGPLLLRTYLQLGEFEKVVNEGTKMVALTPQAKAEILVMVASASFGMGKVAEARKATTEALAAAPGNKFATLAQARLFNLEGKHGEARAVLEQALKAFPEDAEAQRLLGDTEFIEQKFEKAIASYRQAIKLQPDLLGGHAALTYSLLLVSRYQADSARFKEAIDQLEVMRKLAPTAIQTLALQGQIEFARRNYTAAREAAQQLVKTSGAAPAALQLAGAVEFQLGALAQAESYLAQAVLGAPDSMATRRWLALTYLRTGQTGKAIKLLEPVLDRIRDDADLLQLAGEAYMESGDLAKAEQLLLRATKIAPDDPAKLTALAVARINKGDDRSAYMELEQIAVKDKAGITADMALIAGYLKLNQNVKALASIDSLERKQPDNPLVFNLRGRTLHSMRDLAGARKSFERALSLSPAYFPAADALASMDMAENKPAAAAARFEGVIAAAPRNAKAYLALSIVKSSVKAPAEEVLGLINKAVQADAFEAAARVALVDYYLAIKENRKAVAAGQEGQATIPRDPGILFALGRALEAAGEVNQAVSTYEKLADAMPGRSEPYLRIAEVHRANNNLTAAAKSLRKALELRPAAAGAERALAGVTFGLGRSEEAIALARSVQKERPLDATGYLLEGDLGVAKKSLDAAAAAYRAGLQKTDSVELAIKLRVVLLAAGKKAEAEKLESDWIRERPKDTTFRLYLGESAMTQGNNEKAAGYFKAVLELQPENVAALNNLAWVSYQLKQPGAIEYAEKAFKLAPDQPAIMDTLGVLVAEKGDTARALELLGGALAKAPEEGAIRLNYARVLAQSGKKAEARKELEELSKLGDKFSGRAEVAKLLKEL